MRHKIATVVEGEYKEIVKDDGPCQPCMHEDESTESKSTKIGRAIEATIQPRGIKLA